MNELRSHANSSHFLACCDIDKISVIDMPIMLSVHLQACGT